MNVRFSRRGRRTLEPARLVIRDPLALCRARGARRAARRCSCCRASSPCAPAAGRRAAARRASETVSGAARREAAAELEIDCAAPLPRGRAGLAHPLAHRGPHGRDAGAPAGGGRSTRRRWWCSTPRRRPARRRSTGRCAPRPRWRAPGARAGGCALLLPGDRRAVEIDARPAPAGRRCTRGSPWSRRRGARPTPAGSAQRGGDLGERRRPAASRRASSAAAGSYFVSPSPIARPASPPSRWPAAPATGSSAHARGRRRERRRGTPRHAAANRRRQGGRRARAQVDEHVAVLRLGGFAALGDLRARSLAERDREPAGRGAACSWCWSARSAAPPSGPPGCRRCRAARADRAPR